MVRQAGQLTRQAKSAARAVGEVNAALRVDDGRDGLSFVAGWLYFGVDDDFVVMGDIVDQGLGRSDGRNVRVRVGQSGARNWCRGWNGW